MLHPLAPKATADLRSLMSAASVAQQRVTDYARACAAAMGLDPDAPGIRLAPDASALEVPDEPPAPAPYEPVAV
jgi:hypothetical protein